MKTSGEMIMRANGMTGTMLRIGQKVTIGNLELSVLISRKQDRVIVLNHARFFAWYPILGWPPGLAKKTGGKEAPAVKQAGKVTGKMAWLDGQRITFADKGYADSTHWIQTNIAHCTLHSIADEKAEGRPPGGGIVLPARACEDLAAFLQKNDPVVLE
jgi:hypothetical protein